MHVGRTLALAERGDSRTLRRGRVHAVLAGRGRHWRIPRQGGRSMAKARKPEQLLGKLLEDIDIAMLTTIGRDGYLVSRPLSTQKSAFDGRRVWFFTEADSPKIGEIGRNAKVNLAYASKDKNTYVSIAGVASVNRDRALIEQFWSDPLKAFFPRGKDDPNLVLLEL